jgi:hypothetical protein
MSYPLKPRVACYKVRRAPTVAYKVRTYLGGVLLHAVYVHVLQGLTTSLNLNFDDDLDYV